MQHQIIGFIQQIFQHIVRDIAVCFDRVPMGLIQLMAK